MNKDIRKLVEIWEILHQVGGELRDIQLRNPDIKDLKIVIDNSINKLSDVAHVSLSQAQELRKKEVQDEQK